MTKEIYKYPYNVRTEDEIKIFFSDQICEQVVRVTYKNGQIFCTIKDRITSKNKEIILSAAIIFGALLCMPIEASPMGVPPRLPSAHEIHRRAPQHFHQHAQTISPRVDKILMLSTNRMIPLIYLNGLYCYINDHLLKKLRAGDLSGTLTVVTIGVVVYIMCQLSGIDGFTILRELGRLNALTVDPRFGLNPTTPSHPGSTLQITRPTAMPHQEFDGLTKEERRQVLHHHDKIIDVEGHPRLRVGFWQSRYKVPDHGALHGLP